MRRALPVARLRGAGSSPGGLGPEEVRARRAQYGPNAILDVPARAWHTIARETLRDPMLWFLAGVSALYALVGQRTESLTLLAAIAPLVLMDLVLHRRTSASTVGLQGRLAARALAIRNGTRLEVPALDLVPGDLVVVHAGVAFPADGIVVAGEALQADESALTGEAYPVPKQPFEAAQLDGDGREEVFLDGESWALAGTRLLTNEARVRVVFTGAETLYGEIVRSATAGAHARTPLQTAVDRLVSLLVVVAALVCVIVAAVRLRQGFGWLDALVSAATLATAAIPEEFPLALTVFLGVGVYRLARRQALVRRAVCVENIGRVTCLCSDKTGTITEGRLRLLETVTNPPISRPELLRLAALASRPAAGDPLDAVVADAATAAGAAIVGDHVLATFPFTEGRKRETAVVRERSGRVIVATKGAPEVVLARTNLAAWERQPWEARLAQLAAEGGKVLAVAWRPVEVPADDTGGEPDTGYRLAGLLAFGDPVRDGVADAVAACREAGIHTIMITGDHPTTAAAVARQIGLGGATPAVITGDELEREISRSATAPRGRLAVRGEPRSGGEPSGEMIEPVRGEPRSGGEPSGEMAGTRWGLGGYVGAPISIVARATPAQKLALVRALQDAGEVVAVTGDGVNDVPALQTADVGIAMGERATRSAREVAAIILLDDNFRTIVRAIGEGRQLFENLRLSFTYLLMIHIPLVIGAAVVPLAGYPLLFLPAHIVWLELIIHPTALLVFQARPDGTIPRGLPRRQHRLFRHSDWAVIATVGTLLTVLVVSAYVRSVEETGDVDHGRAVALAVLTLASALITLTLGRLRTIAGVVVPAATVVVSALLIQLPPAARMLGLAPLHLDDWTLATVGALLAAALPFVAAVWRRKRGVDAPRGDLPPGFGAVRRL